MIDSDTVVERFEFIRFKMGRVSMRGVDVDFEQAIRLLEDERLVYANTMTAELYFKVQIQKTKKKS